MKTRLVILALGLLLLCGPSAFVRRTSAASCHFQCENLMMLYFEDCIGNGGGYPCTVSAHEFFCMCMASCDPNHPTQECP